MKIKIDIVSDVACPWCYVGHKRLKKALASLENVDAEIAWQPFQLDPTVPMEGKELLPHYISKFGSAEKVSEIFKHMEQVGDGEGINFDFMAMGKTMNTLPLHALMAVAEGEGYKSELKLRFFEAYFENQEDLSNPEVLVSIMEEFGWDKPKTESILKDQNLSSQVSDKINYYKAKGVTGVPFFIFNDKYGMSGAQAPETLANMITQILQEESVTTAEGETCDVDGNC